MFRVARFVLRVRVTGYGVTRCGLRDDGAEAVLCAFNSQHATRNTERETRNSQHIFSAKQLTLHPKSQMFVGGLRGFSAGGGPQNKADLQQIRLDNINQRIRFFL